MGGGGQRGQQPFHLASFFLRVLSGAFGSAWEVPQGCSGLQSGSVSKAATELVSPSRLKSSIRPGIATST